MRKVRQQIVLMVVAGFGLAQHGLAQHGTAQEGTAQIGTAQEGAIRFVPAETNLRFVLNNAASAAKHMVETMPGGVAIFDYNSDGRPDIFFTNGAAVPALRKSDPSFYNRLFRNEGNWKFTDVTEEAGLAGEGYSQGATAGDFDNDGHPDLFVAGLYRNLLYRNLGNGKFAEVTAGSGIQSDEWSVAGGWFDFDGDGLLDLIVTNYGRIDMAKPRFCGDAARGLQVYCHPRYYDPRPNQLYRNLGKGKFADVTVASGLSKHLGRGMSIAFGDYDADGRMDVFVTNDNLPNFLFRNLGNGKFEETGLLAGVALLNHGKPVASMGTDFRDYDNDGRPDIVVTALNGETFPLFRNVGGGMFADQTAASQLGRLTNGHGGWGIAFADFDNDGKKDLFTANSHVNDIVEKFEAATYKQPNTVFRNVGNGRFALATAGLEGAAKAHRGLAVADLDGDGRLDAVVSALGEPAEIWRNVSGGEAGAGNWVAFRLRGRRSNRDGVGAQVRVGGQVNVQTTAVSYAGSALTPVFFGLGEVKAAGQGVVGPGVGQGVVGQALAQVEIVWPSGGKQILRDVAINKVHDVLEENP